MEPAVKVEDVGMMFNLSRQKEERFKEYLFNLLRGELFFDAFWALEDISFEVQKGESLGIIGLNGSGKSTLLKLISGLMKPTRGRVATEGVIAPLIELGGGFDVNMSAKENIFFTGTMHGYSEKYIKERYDRIIDFAEIEDFSDVPVRNFSSGMKARLGFSIATMIDPDILIVDEALSVGDFRFREKCQDRIQDIVQRGAAVLLVSHSMEQVQRMCARAVWLERGHMRMIGPAAEVCQAYKEHRK